MQIHYICAQVEQMRTDWWLKMPLSVIGSSLRHMMLATLVSTERWILNKRSKKWRPISSLHRNNKKRPMIASISNKLVNINCVTNCVLYPLTIPYIGACSWCDSVDGEYETETAHAKEGRWSQLFLVHTPLIDMWAKGSMSSRTRKAS